MKINEYFENEFLVAGNTYDNFIFENCPNEFLSIAKAKLKESREGVKSVVICISREQERCIEQTINNCQEDFQKKILARDIITALIVRELLQYKSEKVEKINFVNSQISAFMHNDFEKVKEFHALSFMPHDVKKLHGELGGIELSFILQDTQNKILQQAINIFVSSREPYSVKIFTNSEKLPTYYDVNGNFIECPHDFMRRDVNDFIEIDDIENE